jgi:hypothetical protein
MTRLDDHEAECPNCHIKTLCEIEVVMKDMPLLADIYGIGRYLSCPACPWAAPMLVIASPMPPSWFKEG